MSCKLPQCFPVSLESIDTHASFETFNNEEIENFENNCPKGYVFYGCPNPDIQSVHDGNGTYFVNPTSGSNKLPHPVEKTPGCVGWSVVVQGPHNQSVTTTIKTHVRRTDSPGFRGQHTPINPDAFTFADAAGVKKIESTGNQYMGYCLLAPPTPITDFTFSNVTSTGFTVTWTGGVGATSYTYTLNGTPTTPTPDNGLTSNSATFTGLVANQTYALITKAINLSGTIPGSSSVTLPPGPTTAPVTTAPVTTAPVATTAAVLPGAPLSAGASSPSVDAASSLAGASSGADASSVTPVEEPKKSNTMLYAGIGGGVVVVLIIAYFLMSGGKKKDDE